MVVVVEAVAVAVSTSSEEEALRLQHATPSTLRCRYQRYYVTVTTAARLTGVSVAIFSSCRAL